MRNNKTIGEILHKYKDRYGYHHEHDLNATDQKVLVHNSGRVLKEGVYYTFFIYEKLKSPTRRLNQAQSHMILWEDKQHLMIKGKISYLNSVGYLNAEQIPMMSFYPAMAAVYILMLCFWGWKMNDNKEHIINLHLCVLAILSVSLFDCFMRWGTFMYNNDNGHGSFGIVFFQITVQVLRDTFARVTLLVVSLGYGILIKSISRYQNKIFILSICYFASQTADSVVLYLNYFTPISQSILLIVGLPSLACNVTFVFWTWAALRRTLNYLQTKEQMYKFSIISRIFVCISCSIIAAFILMIVEILWILSNSRDSDWKSVWIIEACWFIIFTVAVFALMIILQPNESSNMLT
jgi:hypothetical protein